MRKCAVFDDERVQEALSLISKKIEDLQIESFKQASIENFFVNISLFIILKI